MRLNQLRHRPMIWCVNYIFGLIQTLLLHHKFCGPEGNRTLHSLLARKKRQPWYMQAHNKILKVCRYCKIFAGIVGSDPTTWALTAPCSTNWAIFPLFSDPSEIRTRDNIIKSDVLYPTKLRGHSIVGRNGFEPLTPSFHWISK